MLQLRDCAIREGKFQNKLVKVAVDPVQSSPVNPVQYDLTGCWPFLNQRHDF